MKLEIELNDITKRTCEDIGRSNPFVADNLLAMLNDACVPDAPDRVVLDKSQVALLVLLSHLGFSMVAAFQAHLLREKGIDPYTFGLDALTSLVEEELNEWKKERKEEEGGNPPLK